MERLLNFLAKSGISRLLPTRLHKDKSKDVIECPWYLRPFKLSLDHDVDWSSTKAYSHGVFHCVWINCIDREPLGVVEHGTALGTLVEEIKNELFGLSFDGDRVFDKVENIAQFYGSIDQDSSLKERLRGNFQGTRIFSARNALWRGMHRITGFYAAKGPHISASPLDSPEIRDLAASIMAYHFGQVPTTMTGRPLFSRLRRGEKQSSGSGRSDTDVLSPEEEALIIRRLEDLGYI